MRLQALARRRPARLPGDVPLLIDQLISPVRYDVVVRELFLRFVERNIELYHRDFDRFRVEAESEPYHAWFRAVAAARIIPGNNRPEDISDAFRQRVGQTARLFLSFSERGFDARHPIGVRTAGPEVTTSTGKRLVGRRFPTDGCHRLALLRLAGHRHLRPEWYQFTVDRRWSPPDNTGTLIPVLGISPDDYFAFLSLGYATERFTDEASLLAHVAETDPSRLAELRHVITVDAPALNSLA